MPSRPRTLPAATRRAQIVDAAVAAFTARGVEATSVDDIVRAAGIAKGTFYLYFATKDEIVTAVAERMVQGVADRVEAAVHSPELSPVDQLLSLGSAMADVGAESYERELLATIHRPENRPIHDRMSERVIARLAPILASVIADGIAAGLFAQQDAGRSAWFVMACFGGLHDIVAEPRDLPAALAELNAFIMRGLGHPGTTAP